MKFKRFEAKGVFGYLDFDISFNDDVSFLVGGNGSGKTTALRLMNALSNPNFKELLSIPFEKIVLKLGDDNDNVEITSFDIGDEKILKVSTLDDELRLPSYADEEMEYYPNKSEKIEEMIADINRKYSSHNVVKSISKIQSPIFLGLERRRESSSKNKDDYFLEREMWIRHSSKRSFTARRLIQGSLGVSLMETELLVQNAYRRLRELEDRQSNKLRDAILLSAFEYSQLDEESLKPDLSSWREKSGLLERQREIKDALTNIGVKDKRLSTEVDNFFTKLTELFEQLADTGEGITLEWLLNKAQIDRMLKIVEIIDEHRSKLNDLFKPINEFLNIINNFYKDSGKQLEIDAVGQLTVKDRTTRDQLLKDYRQEKGSFWLFLPMLFSIIKKAAGQPLLSMSQNFLFTLYGKKSLLKQFFL